MDTDSPILYWRTWLRDDDTGISVIHLRNRKRPVLAQEQPGRARVLAYFKDEAAAREFAEFMSSVQSRQQAPATRHTLSNGRHVGCEGCEIDKAHKR